MQQRTAQDSCRSRISHQQANRIQAEEEEEREQEEESETSRFDEIILFCGNPGVGKSTLCNSIFQTAAFNSV